MGGRGQGDELVCCVMGMENGHWRKWWEETVTGGRRVKVCEGFWWARVWTLPQEGGGTKGRESNLR